MKKNSIYLKMMTDNEIEYIVKWVNDPEINHTLFINQITPEGTKEWLQKVQKDNTRKDFIVFDNNNDIPIGFASIVNIDYKNLKAETYLCIGEKSYWGRGYGTKIKLELIKYIFDEMNFNKCYSYNWAKNEGMIKINENLGFSMDGLLREDIYINGEYRDRVLFTMIREDYINKYKNEKNINILVTSAGRRTQLLSYLQKELKGQGNLVVTDCSKLAPTLYMADKHYIVPRIDADNYIDTILDICKKENIKGIFSLIDPELSLISKNKEKFEELGVLPIVSSYEKCELWLDKYKTGEFCRKKGFKYPKTYYKLDDFIVALDKKEIDFPVFIKPRKGSASLNINKVEDLETARLVFNTVPNMIIQEFLDGQELGIDVYVDIISKEIIDICAKEKILMRAGETDKAKSIKCDILFELVENIVKESGLIGPLDVDVFEVDGRYYISEINPRFGGGYPLSYECGSNFMGYILNNLEGKINSPRIGKYVENRYMMKHDTLLIKNNIR